MIVVFFTSTGGGNRVGSREAFRERLSLHGTISSQVKRVLPLFSFMDSTKISFSCVTWILKLLNVSLLRLYGSNVCGEGGEYETLTLDCPLFTVCLLRNLSNNFDSSLIHDIYL